MSSPDPPIGADTRNYNPSLEPAPAAIHPEQQASSSRSTLENLLPNAPGLRFLGFYLCPMEDLSPSSRAAFVDEIVHWTDQIGADEGCVESTLLFMSAIFSQTGNTLGWRCQDGTGRVVLHRNRVFGSFL
jgi:hypothetical protein